MAGLTGTGTTDPIAAIRRGTKRAILRHRIYAAVAVGLLVALLLAVPKQALTAGRGIPNTRSVTVAPGITPATAAYASGATVGGVRCGPGIRQVPWSDYAPPCQPAWRGSNGGATTRGVTGSTIVLSYRSASTSQLAELYALVPPGVIGTNAEEVATMKAYVNAFNKEFELYGRHVVLRPYQGAGDFISEDLGEDQAQAEEDATTVASSIGAFADISLIDSSAVYSADLAAQHVVTSSLYENELSWYQQYAPWEYTPGPNCTKAAQATAAILGKQLGGLPASLAGDADLRDKTRVFGIIYPQNPQAAGCQTADVDAMARYHRTVVKSVGIQFDLSQLVQQSQSAVAQMKAAGVTTIIVSSADPVTPTFMMQAADSQDYHPEWWFQSYFTGGQTNTDSLNRLFPADQRDHVLGVGNPVQPPQQQEAIRAYDIGNRQPGAKPIPSYIYTYASLLQFFDALQLAGPDLTPQNFQVAMSHIPRSSPGGMLGGWNGADGPYDPSSTYKVVAYSNTAISLLDGQPGAFVACDGGRVFSYDARGADVPAHTQLTCSGPIG
ncbi:MAG: hypothetical protein ACLP9C_10350 [Acidimicrobiales bacterium]